tara:strand:- start:3875 stop:4645 length:771 start_codon:yes stop_codon:yes gene_type:complete
MSDFVVAIPSYDRPKELNKKTLTMLQENNISKNIITVFVANSEQKKIYEEEIGTDYKIVVGVKGMVNIRNFMTNHYPSGKKILFIDDDISRIVKGESSGLKVTKVTNLKTLATNGFNLCKKSGYALWGLHPSSNPRSLKSSNLVTNTLKYIIGAIYGVVNDKSIKVSLDSAEDYERTLKYYIKYGGVVRFNNYSGYTTYYSKGGMESAGRTSTKEDSDKKALVRKYPKYAETYTRGSGRTEIRLKAQGKDKDGDKN